MSKELVISSNRHETKVAILEDDQLVEIYFQRANEYSLAGSIHKGRVTRVLPGMQSAFVDLGLERDTFLYVSDFFEENEDFDKVSDAPKQARPDFGRKDGRSTRLATQAAAPPTSEPAAPTETSDPVAVAAPETQERLPGRDRDRDRDRRGRGRRRRGRGSKGFPESKYASELAPSGEEGGDGDADDEVPDAPPREVFLLPGESLAKYRNSPAAEASETAEIAADLDAPVAPPDTEEESENAALDHPIAAFPETAVYVPPVVVPMSPVDVDGDQDDSTGVPGETSNAMQGSGRVGDPPRSARHVSSETLTADADDEGAAVAEKEDEMIEDALDRAEELTGSTDIHSIEDLLAETEVDDDETEEDVPAAEDEEESIATLEKSEEASADNEAADEDKPAIATVREPGAPRFVQRGGRGRRRRRGGRDHGERPERPEREASSAETVAAPVREERPSREHSDKPPLPSISDLLKEGQEIIVQIAKEPLGQKGARITSHVALPGRYVVYMPSLEHLGVSRKIESDEERHRLKRVLMNSHAGLSGGFIVRTAGEGRTQEEIAADMQFLYNLWLDIRQKAERKPAPVLLHHDLDIVQRTLRDQMTDDFKAVWCDNEELYESVLRFMQRFQPVMVSRVKLYTRSAPIFDAFNITQELEKALRPKVWLKSGGYIVINQTEALVAIDINTGKYVGKSNRLEDTIVKTNVEAVKEIVRQIRLRDLGGIIVVDFIDMDERKNRQKVMQALEETMRADRAPYKILQFNDFGLVAITRKRVKQSLERTLCAPCPMCEGAGYVKSVQTVVSEILQEAHKIAKVLEGKDVLLRAHPEVARFLKSAKNQYLEEIEEVLGRPVLVKGDPHLHPEKFDLI